MKFPGFDGKLATQPTHSEFQSASSGTELTYSIKIIYNSNQMLGFLDSRKLDNPEKNSQADQNKNKLQPPTEMILELNPYT